MCLKSFHCRCPHGPFLITRKTVSGILSRLNTTESGMVMQLPPHLLLLFAKDLYNTREKTNRKEVRGQKNSEKDELSKMNQSNTCKIKLLEMKISIEKCILSQIVNGSQSNEDERIGSYVCKERGKQKARFISSWIERKKNKRYQTLLVQVIHSIAFWSGCSSWTETTQFNNNWPTRLHADSCWVKFVFKTIESWIFMKISRLNNVDAIT